MTSMRLQKHPSFAGVPGPVVVVVMDGVGIGPRDEGDAVHLARTPHLDRLARTVPTTTLAAHGVAVGLPSDGDMGNSEVGHNALGAGRVFDQGAKLVQRAIEDGSLFEGDAWKTSVARVRESGEPLHFLGLLSDGNVHSHIEHLFAMLRRASAEGVKRARVHALLDGRDVGQTSALEYVEALERVLAELSVDGRDYRVASGGGRMTTTMDRYEADWSMVARGWELHVRGEGRGFASLGEAVRGLRDEQPGVIDQNLPGFVIRESGGEPVGPIRDGAAVILWNFRGDRALEITRAFEEESFSGFERGPRPDVSFAGMMQYDGDLHLPARFLVEPPTIEATMGEYLAASGVSQLAISETQKYGHVTYFWNGNRSEPFDPKTERYIEIESQREPFEERPWMRAAEITDRLIAELRTGEHRALRVNYANGDMVGHTGALEATVAAVGAVDLCVGRLAKVVRELGGAMIVTADHGNADDMFQRNKKTGRPVESAGSRVPKTSHTLNAVPCHVLAPGSGLVMAPLEQPGLSNVAATTLHLLGFAAPDDYRPSLLTESR